MLTTKNMLGISSLDNVCLIVKDDVKFWLIQWELFYVIIIRYRNQCQPAGFFQTGFGTSKQRFEQRFSQRLLVTSQDIPKVYCVFPCGCVFKMWYILHLGHLDIREIMIKPEILGILFSDRIHVS